MVESLFKLEWQHLDLIDIYTYLEGEVVSVIVQPPHPPFDWALDDPELADA